MAALQRREYALAADTFRSVLGTYPDEKELHERVRVYLAICERQAEPPDRTPKTIEERLYAATLAINAGAYDQGVRQLEAVREEDPANDHVHYMLAVAHTLRGEPEQALSCLQRAVELNPENRLLARQDPDLESIRHNERFRAILESAALARRSRRAAPRSRSSR